MRSGIKAPKKTLKPAGELPSSNAQLIKQLRRSGKMVSATPLANPIVPSENVDPRAITRIEYDALQVAFEHFNKALFADNPLPNVAIVLECRAHSSGSFAPNRFTYRGGDGGREHKLSLNPDSFTNNSDKSICQTLLHEMCHLWQHLYGRQPPRKKHSYHDREFATAMEMRGLMTSSTGMPGGARTGTRMSDYAIPDAAFEQTFAALEATGWKPPLESAVRPGAEKKPPSKLKFSCPECSQNAWGRPTLAIRCELCDVRMTAPPDAALSEAAE